MGGKLENNVRATWVSWASKVSIQYNIVEKLKLALQNIT